MSRSRSAACSRRRAWRHWPAASRPARWRGRGCGASRGRPRFALSFAQRRLWFLDRLEGPGATYTLPMAVRLGGRLEAAALAAALGDVMERHESLRTVFPETGGIACQRILDASAVRPVVERSVVSEGELAGALCAAAQRGFDLAREAPLRAHLFELGAEEHVLLVVLHHIASDGWSMAPLWRDLGHSYAARLTGRAPEFSPLPVQYADYTLWQHEVLGRESDADSAISRQLSYWTQTLAGLPDQLELPSDRARPAVSSHHGGHVGLQIEPALHRGLLGLGREAGASLFMVLQAGLAALLSRVGAGTDIAIGSPIAGRTDGALDDLVGFFVNTLVLRTDTSGNPGFRQLLGRVRAGNLAAYSHQDVPFERLVEVVNPSRSLARHPLFQVMLALQNNAPANLELAGLSVAVEAVATGSAKFDLTFSVAEQRTAAGLPAGITGVIEYASDLFDRESVTALGRRLVRLLEAAVAEPERAIGRLDILDAGERQTLVRDWNATGRPVAFATVAELFAAQAARTPDAVAVVFEDHELSYRQLDERANRLAHHLRGLGVGPEVVVGLCVERSLEMIVGLLGILKAGGAYLPLDPGYPPERLAFMLEDARAPVLLTHAALAADASPPHDRAIVDLDADWPAIAQQPASAPPGTVRPHNAAYVIYTSGSTGKPKAAPNTHHGLRNRLSWMQDTYLLGPEDVVLQKTPITFDVSVWELFWPLIVGARLALIAPGMHGDPVRVGGNDPGPSRDDAAFCAIDAAGVPAARAEPSVRQSSLPDLQRRGSFCRAARSSVAGSA